MAITAKLTKVAKNYRLKNKVAKANKARAKYNKAMGVPSTSGKAVNTREVGWMNTKNKSEIVGAYRKAKGKVLPALTQGKKQVLSSLKGVRSPPPARTIGRKVKIVEWNPRMAAKMAQPKVSAPPLINTTKRTLGSLNK